MTCASPILCKDTILVYVSHVRPGVKPVPVFMCAFTCSFFFCVFCSIFFLCSAICIDVWSGQHIGINIVHVFTGKLSWSVQLEIAEFH